MKPRVSSSARVLALPIGDVNGIGPEVALKAARAMRLPSDVRLVLIGSRSALAAACRRQRVPVPPAWSPAPVPPPAPISCWTPPGIPAPRIRPGCVAADAGRAAAAWVRGAALEALAGRFAGLVTAPLCKEAVQRAGVPFVGQTEWLADIAGVRRFEMMLLAPSLRVVLATRHVPLRDVPRLLTSRRLLDTFRLTAQALAWLGLRRRRIAVCGLNPHAGEGGHLGDEERRILRPAIRAAVRAGLPVEGPLPGDTVFHHAARGRHDAVVAMYHDQGLAPLKLIGFEQGVNWTLGLPFVRTSPDHGTAFDLAGRNRANPSSMLAALELAIRLLRRPNPWARPVPRGRRPA